MKIKAKHSYNVLFFLTLLPMQTMVQGMEPKNPMHDAVRQKDAQLLQMRISRSPQIDMLDDQGQTALHLAASTNFPEGARMLLASGATHLRTQGRGRERSKTPFELAVDKGNVAVAQVLIEHGALKGANEQDLLNLWQAAFKNRDIDMVKLLNEKINLAPETNGNNFLGLREAIRSGNNEAVLELLRNMPINLPIEENQGTALHAAARGGQIHIARLLLERGADCNFLNKGEETPLQINEQDREGFIRLFLLYGLKPSDSLKKEIQKIETDPELKLKVFNHPLEEAATMCNVNEIKQLLTTQKETISSELLSESLAFAASHCCHEAAQSLLNAGAMPTRALEILKGIYSRPDFNTQCYEKIKQMLENHLKALKSFLTDPQEHAYPAILLPREILRTYLMRFLGLSEPSPTKFKREPSGSQ